MNAVPVRNIAVLGSATRRSLPGMLGLIALALVACAQPARIVRAPAHTAQSVHPVPRDADLPLALITAELAVQRNDLAAAADAYAQAMMLSEDAAVPEQATRLAIASRQWPLAEQGLERWRVLDPDAVGIRQSMAWMALARGNTEAAFTALEGLFTNSTDEPWRLAGQVLIGAENTLLASTLLERLATPERLGQREEIWVGMSQLAFKLGDKRLAARLADEAVAKFAGADAFAWSAKLAVDQDDKPKARKRYEAALKQFPQSVALRAGYAAFLAAEKDFAGAARVVGLGPQDDITFAARAAYAVRAEDKALQQSLYQELKREPGPRSGKRLYLLGQVAELVDRPADAARWYAEVPRGDEHWIDAGMRQVVLSDRNGDGLAAKERLETLKQAAKGDAQRSVQLVLLQAELLVRHQHKDEALAAYDEGLALLPGDTTLLYARAMLAIDLGRIDAGERDLRAVLAADPDSADALNALGYTLADKTDRLTEATELIEKAIRIKPDEPAIIDSHGWLKYRLGKLDEAETLLRKAFARFPDSEVAAHLGEVLWVRGEHAEARQVWQQGREKDADNKVLKETIERLTQ